MVRSAGITNSAQIGMRNSLSSFRKVVDLLYYQLSSTVHYPSSTSSFASLEDCVLIELGDAPCS